MTVIALTNFLEVTDASGNVQHRFQNSKPGESINYGGYSWPFLSFVYQGAAKNRTGDNLESQLYLANNAISMGYAVQAVTRKWNVRIDSCSMNPTTFDVGRLLTTEHWLVASMGYNPEAIEVLLSSSIDAVGATAPTRVLTTKDVGALPVTAAIQNR